MLVAFALNVNVDSNAQGYGLSLGSVFSLLEEDEQNGYVASAAAIQHISTLAH